MSKFDDIVPKNGMSVRELEAEVERLQADLAAQTAGHEQCERNMDAEIERLRKDLALAVATGHDWRDEVEHLREDWQQEQDHRVAAEAEAEALRVRADDLTTENERLHAALEQIAEGDIPFADGLKRAGYRSSGDFEAFARAALNQEEE